MTDNSDLDDICLDEIDYELDQFDERIELMKKCGALERLVECLKDNKRFVQHPVLRASGNYNIITRNDHDEHTQVVIHYGCM